jgi:hypothetical protein
MARVSKTLSEEWELACVPLSPAQWRDIQNPSKLPESARERLEHLFAYYKIFQQASITWPRAAQTRKELLCIAELAEKLITAIIGVKADERTTPPGVKADVLAALMLPAAQPTADADDMTATAAVARRKGLGNKGEIRSCLKINLGRLRAPTAIKLLYERVLTVEQLRLWFENAARSLPAQSKGARKAAENHRWLVSGLDAILAEYTGRHLSRSKRDKAYVELCFAAADPNVGPGSINEAMQASIRLRRRAEIAAKNRA